MFDADEMDAEFEAQAAKVPAERQYGGGNLDKLPDGEHVFEITDGELKKTAKTVTYTLKFCVTTADGAGQFTGEKTYWLKGKDGIDDRSINGLKADLGVLGFDTAKWSAADGRPFLGELQRIKPLMPGLRFKGKKKTTPNKNDATKPYVNVYVNGRGDGDGKPAVLDNDVITKCLLSSADAF